MRKILAAIILTAISISPVFAHEGLVSVKSAHAVKATADRLETVLQSKGMKVFQRIDHAAGAASVGNSLRPTELIIFGNPKIGSQLMLCSQSIAIDLPQKALIWEDANGQVWLSYNDPGYLTRRHKAKGCDALVGKVSMALANFAKAATSQ
tara:strand:- start:3 stop:455 length:453 start_codon:yes stop_codon:yes gene_type:complete